MDFREGESVFDATGEKVGDLSRVVINPSTRRITHLVVKEGFLFPADKLLPIEMVESTDNERITLNEAIRDPDALPDFRVSEYISPGEEEVDPTIMQGGYAPPLYWYPQYGAAWGMAPFYQPPMVANVRENIPDYLVALHEGAKVITSDGQHAGDIEQVLTDQKTDSVSHIIITSGLLFKHRKMIPVHWIKELGEEEIHLGVGASLLDRLPPYEPEEKHGGQG